MKLYDHYHKFHPPFMSRCTELIRLRYSDLLEVKSLSLCVIKNIKRSNVQELAIPKIVNHKRN